jgi:poly [ADP-ribose] polymerase 2/3/4
MKTIESIQLICVEQGESNHNKFWKASLKEDFSVLVEWGRVGKSAQTQEKNFSNESQAKSFIEKKQREKEKKGYELLDMVSDVPSVSVSNVKSHSNIGLQNVAKKQIKHTNKYVSSLIDYLTTVNAHNIMEATKGAITYNDTTGLFSTPLGIVGQNSLNEANNLLIQIGDLVAKNKYNSDIMQLSQKYLRYIPTDIGMKKFEPSSFWRDLNEVQKQKQIVDALQASLISATTEVDSEEKVEEKEKSIFDVELDLVEDAKTIDKIRKFYEQSKGSHRDVQSYKVKTVYSVNIASEREKFKNNGAKMDNIWNLFHGTASSNVLSILKQGIIVPPASSKHCTGRLYGDGVYGSDQSTKALRYATGGWGGKTSNRTFMFIMDMAMGKYYEPNRNSYMSVKYPVKGYNSTFAKAGQGGVMNNEMIVYNTNQVQLRYLIEFSK